MARKRHRKHRRSRRSYSLFRNPLGGAIAAPVSAGKQMFSGSFATEAAMVAVGFVLPGVVMSKLPISVKNATWKGYASKVATVAVLAGLASMFSRNKRISKALLLGGGVALLLDVYADFIHPMISGMTAGGAPAAGGGTGAYWGNPGDGGVGAFFGGPGDPGSLAGPGDPGQLGAPVNMGVSTMTESIGDESPGWL